MSCVLCGSDEDLDDRGSYVVCASCAKEQDECKERVKNGVILDRNCSDLCVRCGLCCVVLSAVVDPDEIEELAKWSGKLPTEISMVEKLPFPGAGKLVLKRPCVFLLGKPGEYVSCRAYKTKRPHVCGSYLCKLAIRYKAGACSLNEAIFILRGSVSLSGDLGLFNWSDDEYSSRDVGDRNLAKLIAVHKALDLLGDSGPESEKARLALYSAFHPRYKFVDNLGETVFAAIAQNYKNKKICLNHFVDEQIIDGWTDKEKEVAIETTYQVVGGILEHFVVVPNE